MFKVQVCPQILKRILFYKSTYWFHLNLVWFALRTVFISMLPWEKATLKHYSYIEFKSAVALKTMWLCTWWQSKKFTITQWFKLCICTNEFNHILDKRQRRSDTVKHRWLLDWAFLLSLLLVCTVVLGSCVPCWTSQILQHCLDNSFGFSVW